MRHRHGLRKLNRTSSHPASTRLRDGDIVVRLFDELGPRYKARNGGYLRILKFGFRQGDNAPMALVELLDRPEPVDEAEEKGDKKAVKKETKKESRKEAKAA